MSQHTLATVFPRFKALSQGLSVTLEGMVQYLTLGLSSCYNVVVYQSDTIAKELAQIKEGSVIYLRPIGELADTIGITDIICFVFRGDRIAVVVTNESTYVVLDDGETVLPNKLAKEYVAEMIAVIYSDESTVAGNNARFIPLYNRLGEKYTLHLDPPAFIGVEFRLVGDDEHRVGQVVNITTAQENVSMVIETRGANYHTYPLTRIRYWRPY